MTTISWNNTVTTENISRETFEPYLPVEYLLWISNEKQYEINRPTVIIFIISIILGLIGNLSVIYVFGSRFKITNANIFVTCLAIFDTLTCFILVFEAMDLRYPMYSGNYPEICKTVRFLEVFCNSCSSILLVCIAMDRFYAICKPFVYISFKKVKRLLIAVIITMLLLSWPIAFLHGTETLVTPYPQVTGKDCADDDRFKGSLYSGLYFFILLIITFCCIIAVIVLYCRIYWAIIKWKFTVVGENHDSEIWSTGGSSKLPFQGSKNVETVTSKSAEIQNRSSRFVVLREKSNPSKNLHNLSDSESPKHSHSVTAQYFTDFKNYTENSSAVPCRRSKNLENETIKDSTIQRRPSRFVVLGENYKVSENPQSYLFPESPGHSKTDAFKHHVDEDLENLSDVHFRRSISGKETGLQRRPSRFVVLGENHKSSKHRLSFNPGNSQIATSEEYGMTEDLKRYNENSSNSPIRGSSFFETEFAFEPTIQRRQSRFVTLAENFKQPEIPQIYKDPPSPEHSENLPISKVMESHGNSKNTTSEKLELPNDFKIPIRRLSKISFRGSINMENVSVLETTIQRRRSKFDVLSNPNEASEQPQSYLVPENPVHSQIVTSKFSHETNELDRSTDRSSSISNVQILESSIKETISCKETTDPTPQTSIGLMGKNYKPPENSTSSTDTNITRNPQITTSDELKVPTDFIRPKDRSSKLSIRATNNMENPSIQESTIQRPHFRFGENNTISKTLQTGKIPEILINPQIPNHSTEDIERSYDVQLRRSRGMENISRKETLDQRRPSRFVVLGENYKPPQAPKSHLVPKKFGHFDITSSKEYLMKENLKRSLSLNENVTYRNLSSPASQRLRSKSVSFHSPVRDVKLKKDNSNTEIKLKPKLTKVEDKDKISVDESSKRKHRNTNLATRRANVRTSSTTIMFSLTALLYVLSYIPTLIVESINAVQPLNLKSMSVVTRQLIVMANSAYFFNLSFNPIIYGVFNRHFRKEMVLLLKGQVKK